MVVHVPKAAALFSLAIIIFIRHSGWSSSGRITTAGEFFIAESEAAISAGISDSSASGPPATPKSAVKVSGSYETLNNALQLANPLTSSTPTGELDLVGVVLSDNLAHLSGLVDYDQSDSSNPVAVLGASITGSFAEDTSNQGRATGSVMILTPTTAGAYPFISPAGPSFNVAYYRINSSQAFVLQTDASASSSGLLFQQLLP